MLFFHRRVTSVPAEERPARAAKKRRQRGRRTSAGKRGGRDDTTTHADKQPDGGRKEEPEHARPPRTGVFSGLFGRRPTNLAPSPPTAKNRIHSRVRRAILFHNPVSSKRRALCRTRTAFPPGIVPQSAPSPAIRAQCRSPCGTTHSPEQVPTLTQCRNPYGTTHFPERVPKLGLGFSAAKTIDLNTKRYAHRQLLAMFFAAPPFSGPTLSLLLEALHRGVPATLRRILWPGDTDAISPRKCQPRLNLHA